MEEISICKQVSFAPALIFRGCLKDFRTHNPGDYANTEITFTANTVTHTHTPGQTGRLTDQESLINSR